MTKARDLGKLVSQGQPLADGTVQASEVSGLAAVATSGSYNDLLNKPTNLGGGTTDYNQLTNKPTFATVATSGSYADLTNKPTLFSGSYTDLTNKPTLFSGSYNDLTDKPASTSGTFSGSYTDLTNKPTLFSGSYTDLTNKPNFAAVATSGSYTDLTNKPTLFSGSYTDLTNKPTLFSGSYTNLTDKPTLATVATTGSYNDLLNKPATATLKGTSITYAGDDLAADPAGGQTLLIVGTGFESTPTVYVGGTIASSVSFVSSTQITFTAPAKSAGTYDVYIVNPGGATAIMVMGISYSGVPAWTTAAGSLGTVEGTFNVQLQATSNSAITYTLANGSTLPNGVTLSSTGLLSGTVASEQTFSFTVVATDAENQDTSRSFQVTVSIVEPFFKNVTLLLAANGPSPITKNYNVTNSGASEYLIDGVSDPTITLIRGYTYTFTVNASGHPFWIKTSQVTGTGSAYNTGVTNNGTQSGTVTFVVPNDAPATLYYICQFHGSMSGTINIINAATNNNTFIDNSINNFAITRNGETSQGAFSPYGECWSNYFDDGLTASSSYITTASSSTFAITDFTIEFFINWTLVQDISSIVDFVGYDTGFSLRASNSGLFMYLQGGTYYSSPVFTWKLGEWYHIAVVRSGSTLYWYVNGTRLGTTTSVPSGAIPAGQARIGGILTGGVYNTSKYISNLRVVSSALYTGSTLTVPTANLTAISGTVLLTCQSNRFKDNSSSNLIITTTGTTTSVQRFSPFNPSQSYSATTIGGSGFFGTPSGTVSNLAISTTGLSSMSTWTIEFWAYNSPTSWSDHAVLGPWGPNLIRDSAGNLEVYLAGSQRFAGIAWRKNQWNHVALSNDNASLRLYVNGTLVNTTTSTTINLSTMVIGSEQTTTVSNDKWNGYITDFRVINGTALYSGSTITVPTTPLAAITNTSLLLQFTNAGIIDNAMIHDLTTAGNVQISTSNLKYGSGSLYFDGSGDFLKIPYNDLFNIGGGDYTAEAWIYPTQHGEIVGAFNLTGPNFAGWLLSTNFINGTGKLGTYFANTTANQTNITSTATVSLNTWSHIAFTKQGTTVRLFINGNLDSTHTLTLTPSGSQQQIHIGADSNSLTSPGRNFGGYIDDLRITKGYARYTSSFTPPAALKTR